MQTLFHLFALQCLLFALFVVGKALYGMLRAGYWGTVLFAVLPYVMMVCLAVMLLIHGFDLQ